MDHEIKLQVGVKILLKNKEGKYLLVKRSNKKYPEVKESWDIVGGRINPGSSLTENLKREVKEETKLDIIGKPRLIAAQDILRVGGRHVVRLTYVGEAEGDPILNEENSDSAWVDFNELQSVEGLDVYVDALLKEGLLKDV